jgi:tetratricopeptide (TPR) repeat protein
MISRALSTKAISSAWALPLCLLLGLFAASRDASAQGKQDGCLQDPGCKESYNQALKLYDEGKYADALPKFEEAYARRKMPWLMLNIGRTLQRLGRPQEAIGYYERYKKAELNIDEKTLERVNKYIEQAQALLAESPQPEPKKPAEGTPQPVLAQPAPQPAPNLVPGEPAKDAPKPIYKKWWFWTIVGVVVVGGVAGGVAGGLAARKSPPPDPIMPGDPVFMPSF